MEILFENWRGACPGSNCLSFSDNLSAHKVMKMIEIMIDEGVFLFFLPKSTSQFLQTLDSAPFGCFKKRMRELHGGIELDVAL